MWLSAQKDEAGRRRPTMPSQVAFAARRGELDRDEARRHQASPAAGTRYGGRWGWVLPAHPVARSCAGGLAEHGTHWAVTTDQSPSPMRHLPGRCDVGCRGGMLLMPRAPPLPQTSARGRAGRRRLDVQSVGD